MVQTPSQLSYQGICAEPPPILQALRSAVENIARCMPATIMRKQVSGLLSGRKIAPWTWSAGSGAGFPTRPAQPASSFLSAHPHPPLLPHGAQRLLSWLAPPCSSVISFFSKVGLGDQSRY